MNGLQSSEQVKATAGVFCYMSRFLAIKIGKKKVNAVKMRTHEVCVDFLLIELQCLKTKSKLKEDVVWKFCKKK